MQQHSLRRTQNNLRKRYQISFRRWLTCKSGRGTIEPYIGNDLPFVRKWVSEQFLEGMNWSNYGTVWVIDHIVPLRLFDFTNDADLKIALHYKNIMPLFKEDNLYKEGALDFSVLMLNRISNCEIVEQLLLKLNSEHGRLKKYLIN